MCGGGSKAPAPPPPPAPIPQNPDNTADRGTPAPDTSMRPQSSTGGSGLGGEQTGTGTSSVLGG
jgi:hypothetical protein